MRRYPIFAATAVGAAAVILTGCSSGSEGGGPQPTPSASSTTTTTTYQTHTAAPGEIAVSPNGVTTAVGAPAASTEEEYFQACHAAKVWIAAQGGDPKTQFEPYLKSLQTTNRADAGTFGMPWSELPPGRQAAVIVAAEAASDDLCG
jgi:Putative lipoprotein LpqV